MIANSDMISNRFARQAKAKALMQRIQDTLNVDGIVTIATHTQAIHYYKKHLSMFKVNRNGVFVQHGKQWNCIDYCAFVFRTPK